LISGCSGGGKSTLLHELESRGFAVVPEPGRRIVQEEQDNSGRALPWIDLEAFARKALKVSYDDLADVIRDEARLSGITFFDRGVIDAAVALEKVTGVRVDETLLRFPRYYSKVFLAPPWPEIFETDEQRQHGFKDAKDESQRLQLAIRSLGYKIHLLPKVSVPERADFIERELNNAGQ